MPNDVKSFLIIGSAGMAGHMVYTYLAERGQRVYGIDIRANDFSVDAVVDTTDFDALCWALTGHRFDCVINCAAILGQPMLDHPSLAHRVNVELPHELARILAGTLTSLFHISSDFVFSGDKIGGGYAEADLPDNTTPYGMYKRQGEVNAPNACNLRLSIIGPTPKRIIPNFFNNVVASTNNSIWGLTNAYWTGVTTLELAKTLLELSSVKHGTSIYHLCSSAKETRYETIRNIMDVFGIDLPLEARCGDPKDYSLLSTALCPRKPLRDQFLELKQWMRDHPDLYGEYACLKK